MYKSIWRGSWGNKHITSLESWIFSATENYAPLVFSVVTFSDGLVNEHWGLFPISRGDNTGTLFPLGGKELYEFYAMTMYNVVALIFINLPSTPCFIVSIFKHSILFSFNVDKPTTKFSLVAKYLIYLACLQCFLFCTLILLYFNNSTNFVVINTLNFINWQNE